MPKVAGSRTAKTFRTPLTPPPRPAVVSGRRAQGPSSLAVALTSPLARRLPSASGELRPLSDPQLSLTLANSEQAHRPRGMRNIGSLSTIS
jgi:hypothetical protein